jgi:hypothetical protein
MKRGMKVLQAFAALGLCAWLTGCATGGAVGQVLGNETGSAPANQSEVPEYKRAVLRCYKTGGTRVVKIEGNLRCF